MTVLHVISNPTAEKRNSPHEARNHAKGKAYLALLKKGPRDSIERVFIRRSRKDRQIWFTVTTRPGDIYELRNWYWDGNRESFMGGTHYIAFDDDNRPVVLSREEAFLSVLNPPVTHHADRTVPMRLTAVRMLPEGVVIS